MMTTIASRWLWTGAQLLENAAVHVQDGVIERIDSGGNEPACTVKLPHHVLMPGLVNAHSHAFQRAFRGHVQWANGHDDFWSWRDAMYRVATSLPPEGIEAIARLVFVEMAQAGVTSIGEFHYMHHQPGGAPYDDPDELAWRVITAALTAGMRITLLRTAYHCGGFNKPASALQARFIDRRPEDVLAAAQRLGRHQDRRVNVGIAPHSVRAVPRHWLPELAAFNGPIHAHVAEQLAEVQACHRLFGRSPLALLADAGLLTERFCAVHLTHPDPGDVALLDAAGGTICVCPTTELDLGDGFLPVEARAASLCVGSDSHAVIDLLHEARTLEMHARGLAQRRNVVHSNGSVDGLARHLLHSATTVGRQALGLASEPLGPGAAADFCAVDLDRPAADGQPPLCAVAFNATADWVSDVWVAGERIVHDGRHALRDSAREAALPWLGATT